MKVGDRNQVNSADIIVNDVSMFSKGNDNNNNNNNNNELSHDLNNVNSTTCPPEDKMNNASRCSVDNINGIKENLSIGKNLSILGTRHIFKRVNLFSERKSKILMITIKPAIRQDPNHFILHIETNDITNASKSEELIAEEILEFALKLKSETHELSISNVIVRRDKWSAKGELTSERTRQEI